MLLPSDVARLVLGYLQQEGLSATSRAFILESPNLREYAEHSSEDGVIPACLFSLFGKNLTTILNEYVAAKTKETSQENKIPAVLTSLWKKLDFTLNQIKSMQNSPAVQQIQRLRTQNSIQKMRRQRALSSSPTPATGCIAVSIPANSVPRPLSAPQGILGHSTPICYTSQQSRPSTISLTPSEDTPLQIMVPDQRFTPGPLSPARRKCDSPRRRGGQSGVSRGLTVTSMLTVESQSQEAMTENLSQMVIENAREKILSDRSLQEKLAENINKILASDNCPQTSKVVCSTVEQEQSLDEILGLQGEIHMTDDAIQDILEQTESDPAFQALFDLFDSGKNKMENENADKRNSTQERDEPALMDSATDTGTGQEESTSGGEPTKRILRSRNVNKTKSKRKTAIPLSTGRPHPASSQPCAKKAASPKGTVQNKKCTNQSRVSFSKKRAKGTSCTLKEQPSNKVQSKSSSDPDLSSSSLSEEGTRMEVDELSSEMSLECSTDGTLQQVLQISQTSTSSQVAAVPNKQTETSPIVGVNISENQCGAEKAGRTELVEGDPEASGQSEPSVYNAEDTSTSKQAPSQEPAQEDSNSSLTTTCSSGPISSEPLASIVSATTATSTTSTVINPSQAQTTESDPNKVVALKIIICDDKEQQQGSDSALNQAVSSISGEHIPTIFLSPPAKAQPKVLPSTPESSITPEETAQAVSSLQGAESAGDLDVNALKTGFIQLLPSNTTFGGPSSYFIVKDPSSGVDQHSSMMLPGGAGEGAVCSTPHIVATPPRSRTLVSIASNVAQPFSPASAIIISSPVQPMMQNMAVPVSVVGQNSTGNLTVVHSQMLALSGPKLLNQSAKIVAKPKLLPKDNVELGKTGTLLSGSIQISNNFQSSVQINCSPGTSPSHRRILCFDENASQASTNTVSSSPVIKESKGSEQTNPSILGKMNAKRRIETIRLSEPSQRTETKESETASSAQQQKEAAESTDTGTSLNSAVQQNQSVRLESKKRLPKSNTEVDSAALNHEHTVKSSSQSLRPKSTSNTTDTSQEENREKRPFKTPEGLTERNVSEDSPNITANKENEVESNWQELRQAAVPVLSTVRALTHVSQGNFGKPTCKTSPLTKQAVEMLQDIQSQSPISTPTKKLCASDLPLPKTPIPGHVQEDLLDVLRTPSNQRREIDGTPKHLAPPATPDLPGCSPVSETGSENSINMAAHTLMILSRAARTGGPLKDSLRQEEVAVKTNASKGKKRKHADPSPTAKKELHLTSTLSSKKKAKKQKKLLDSFPHDLDVDKFLSSLHYDE